MKNNPDDLTKQMTTDQPQPSITSPNRTGQLYLFSVDAVVAFPKQFSQQMMALRRYGHHAVVISASRKMKLADVKAALDNSAVTDKYYDEIVCVLSKGKYAAENAAVMLFDTNADALAKIKELSPRTCRVLVEV